MNLKNIFLLIIVIITCLIFITNTHGEKKAITLKLPMCTIDLNGDKINDFVFLVYNKWKVFVLLTKNKEYKLHIIKHGRLTDSNILSCYKRDYIIETEAGDGDLKTKKERTIKVPEGSYFEIIEPECCSVAYYWKDNTFKKIWTSD